MNSKQVVEGLKPNVSAITPEDAIPQIVATFAESLPVWENKACRVDVVSHTDNVVQYKLPVSKFVRGRSLHGIFKAVSDLYENRFKSVKVDRGVTTKAETNYHYVTVTIGWN
jgi:hypothetical protein